MSNAATTSEQPAATAIKNRSVRFLIWQSLQSTLIISLIKLSPLSISNATTLSSFCAFFAFHLSLISLSLCLLASPPLRPAASLIDIIASLLRLVFVSGGQPMPTDFRRRVRVSLYYFVFVMVAGFSGSIGLVSLCWGTFGGWKLVFRGFVLGLFYGFWCLYRRRLVLEFPIIQRPSFFDFKMGVPLAAQRAVRLSCVAYLLSTVFMVFMPTESKGRASIGKFIEQTTLFTGTFAIFLCWELNHHLHQVLHTKRVEFAPLKGSAAAETNPSEPLLLVLEESTSRSLIQYLAYLDLCMVCENNVDTWRRAAFFEETGETYRKVMAACLKPLEQFASELSEGLESNNTMDKSIQLSNQLKSPVNLRSDSKLYETFYDLQLYAWCARAAALLTVRSRKEDRFGVAQLSGSNASTMSILLSCLLAVEALMGKKTNLQSQQLLTGPVNIKWATQSSGRREVASATSVIIKRRGKLYSKAYSMADILRTSIYSIVSAFHDEMANSSKSGLLDKEWIRSSKPLFGTHELLLQKLCLFLEYRAN